jgi:hypothetical protein
MDVTMCHMRRRIHELSNVDVAALEALLAHVVGMYVLTAREEGLGFRV